MPEDPWKLLKGWQRLLQAEVVFSGSTAAWLHGLDFDPIHPVEIVVPRRSGVRSRIGLVVRRCDVSGDVTRVRGLRATAVHRTLLDLSKRLPSVETLVAMDAAIHSGLTDRRAMMAHSRLRVLAQHAAPAESPMETRLLWLLIKAGLPSPDVQSDLHDPYGRFVGRADLYYPAAGLVIEYDGVNHRDRLVEDDRRQNLINNAGYQVLRFTASDILQRADVVQAQVLRALRPIRVSGSPASGRERRAEAASA